MKTNTSNELTSTQQELQALRERIKQNTESMLTSTKKVDVNDAMSGVIKVIGTFEKS
ncbi:hypothetical protein [Vibrio sinensis]|nr:hypothetical protein [Vibrio sinensis]